MTRYSLALFLVLAAPAAFAAGKCDRAPNPVEQAICADPAVKRLDARLNEAWNRRRAGLSGVELEALLADQRSWLRGRAGACNLPGTGVLPPNRLKTAGGCLAEQYRLRIAALNGTAGGGQAKAGRGVDPGLLHRAWLVDNRCQTLDFAGSALLGEAHGAVLAGMPAAEWAGIRERASADAAAVECNKPAQTAFVKELAITLGDAR